MSKSYYSNKYIGVADDDDNDDKDDNSDDDNDDEVKNRLEDPVTEAGMGVFRKTFLTETVSHFLYFNNISIANSVNGKNMQQIHN